MAREIKIGMNRTGIATSPIDSKSIIEAAEKTRGTDGKTMFDVLSELSRASEPVGHIPPPSSLSGLAKTGMNKLMGKQSEIFLDQLGERLAHPVTGTGFHAEQDGVIRGVGGLEARRHLACVHGVDPGIEFRALEQHCGVMLTRPHAVIR